MLFGFCYLLVFIGGGVSCFLVYSWMTFGITLVFHFRAIRRLVFYDTVARAIGMIQWLNIDLKQVVSFDSNVVSTGVSFKSQLRVQLIRVVSLMFPWLQYKKRDAISVRW